MLGPQIWEETEIKIKIINILVSCIKPVLVANDIKFNLAKMTFTAYSASTILFAVINTFFGKQSVATERLTLSAKFQKIVFCQRYECKKKDIR